MRQATSKFIVVQTTLESFEQAKTLAHKIVSNALGACVQIMPITSFYKWEGKVEEASEVLLQIKTKATLFKKLEAFIKENHPYEVPEIIALPIEATSNDYALWIEESI